jgi:PiT family inorganic phosphate transporter
MVFAWLLTLPGAGLVGGLAAILANFGTVGVVALLLLLAAACSAIWALSRHHRVSRHNVTESREVLVLASVSETTYVEDPRLDPKPEPTQKIKKPKAKSVA